MKWQLRKWRGVVTLEEMKITSRFEWHAVTALISASVLAGVSGCASGVKAPEAHGAHDASDRAALGDAPLSGRTIASTTWNSYRVEMEGDLTEERLQNYFETLWNDDDPTSEILRAIKQAMRIYYQAQHQLRVFDAELDGKTPLHDLNSYPKMLAYWEISRREEQRISYVYEKLLDLRTSRAKNSHDYKKAHRALNELSRFLNQVEGSDRLALHELSSELKPIFDHYAKKARGARDLERFNTFSRTLFDRDEKVSDFARRPDVQEELSERTQDAQDADSDDEAGVIDGTAAQLANKIRGEIKSLTQGTREPQSEALRFFPSSGSHGSLSGSEYPKGTWSITFDDGPSSKYTPMVLANLKEHGFHSTFFELAMNVKAVPKTSLAVLDAGMELANHSYTHPQLPKQDDAHLRHEIIDSTNDEVKVWGESHRPKLFRCPYGAGLTVTRVREMIAKQGFIHVFWNVDTLDWQDKNPDSILARAKKQMNAAGRGIILFHDIHPQSVEASRMVMDWIKKEGLRHETVGAVIQELNDNESKIK